MKFFNINKTEVEALLEYMEDKQEDVVALHYADTGFGTVFHVSRTARSFGEDMENITDVSNW